MEFIFAVIGAKIRSDEYVIDLNGMGFSFHFVPFENNACYKEQTTLFKILVLSQCVVS